VEVELIRIASEVRLASFDQSTVGVWRKILSSLIRTNPFCRLLVPKMIRGV